MMLFYLSNLKKKKSKKHAKSTEPHCRRPALRKNSNSHFQIWMDSHSFALCISDSSFLSN